MGRAGSLKNIRRNKSLSSMQLTDDILSKMVPHSKTTYAEMLNDLDAFGNFLTQNADTKIAQFKGLMTTLTGKSNSSIGVHGVIKEIIENPDLYKNRSLVFEKRVKNSLTNNDSKIDIFIDVNPPLYIEVKWYSGTSQVDEALFIKEFISRDLFNANSLSQILWKMRGNKLTKAEVNNFLSSTNGIAELTKLLNSGKLGALFPNKRITSVNDFITQMNLDNVFNSIFK